MRDSGELLQLIHTGMVNARLDVDAIYERLGYDTRQLSLKECRPRHDLQAYFWRVVEDVTQDSEVGLRLCPYLPVFRGQVLEYLAMSSPTFGDGIRTLAKYQRLISDAFKVRLQQDENGVRIVLTGTSNDAPALRHPEICFVYEFIQALRAVAEDDFHPRSVRLCCDRRVSQEEYDTIFGCPVYFGSEESEIWIDPQTLAMASPHYEPDLLHLHEQYAVSRLDRLARQDLIDGIYNHLCRQFENDSPVNHVNCTLDSVAKELGVPLRRLRARLAAENLCFREIFKRARYAFARQKLRQEKEPLEEIAHLTGFSEPSTFYRAFKEWSGLTPSEYRESYAARRAGAG